MDTLTRTAIGDVDQNREDQAQRVRDLMDPAVLEARLEVARARRAEALAAKAKRSGGSKETESSVAPDDAALDTVTPFQSPRADRAGGERRRVAAVRACGGPGRPAGRHLAGTGRERIVVACSAAAGRVPPRTPKLPVEFRAAPESVTQPVAPGRLPGRPPARGLRLATVFAAALTAGVAVGIISALLLQGWQIAIVPPTADGATESRQSPVESAKLEDAPAPPSVAAFTESGPTRTEAAAAPALLSSELLADPPSLAVAQDVSPAIAVPSAPGRAITKISLPALAATQPPEAVDVQLPWSWQSAPAPAASVLTDALQGKSNLASFVEIPAVVPLAFVQPVSGRSVPALAAAKPTDPAQALHAGLLQPGPVPAASALPGALEAQPNLASFVERPAVVPLALVQPVSGRSVPALAAAKPIDPAQALHAGLLQPGPVPIVVELLQAPSLQTDASARPSLPGGAGAGRPIPAGVLVPTAPLDPVSRHEARPSPPQQPPEPRVVSDARVSMHFPPASSAEADELLAALTGAGFADVSAHPVTFTVTAPQVRFYHEADRSTAERLASLISGTLDGAEVEARSFTSFRPLPEEGLLEVLLAGTAPPPVARAAPPTGARAATPAPRRASRATAPPPQETAAARRAAEQERERQRLTQSVEQMLRSRLR